MIAATCSTPPRSASNLAGERRRHSTPAWPTPSSGTPPTGRGGNRCASGRPSSRSATGSRTEGVKVRITGAGGQLGQDLAAAIDGHDVVAYDHRGLAVTDRDAVLGAITTASPDAIVHTAAWTAVDACEGDADKAFAVNSLGTRHVAEGARLAGAYVCYIS